MDLTMSVNPNGPSSEKEPMYDELQAFVDKSNTEAPAGLKNMVQGS
jgi:hypothetical protein